MDSLDLAVEFFVSKDQVVDITPLKVGNIHDSYIIITESSNDIFLQKINQHVIPNYKEILNNTLIITDYLCSTNFSYQLSKPICCKNNNYFFQFNGEVWRAFTAIKDSYSVDQPKNSEQVYLAAKAFSEFQKTLAGLPKSKLNDFVEPIPGFMDNPARLEFLNKSYKSDLVSRARSCADLVKQINSKKSNLNFISSVRNLINKDLCITHGDMKLNNILFSKHNSNPISIIDLDTCVLGDYLFDYGDFLRFACSSLPEDSDNFDNIDINQTYFLAGVNGFKEGAFDLMPKEIWDKIHLAAAEVTLALSCRFLSDYLNGDKYFTVQYTDHNLVRAKNQFKLFEKFISL
jgi:hypothetical protein